MIEIVIITFNRLETLRHTLEAIKESELSKLKITVLDNCSDDGSSELLRGISQLGIPNLRHIRNVINVGASANLMRAYELATEKYLWVLCDDDVYDFCAFQDVMEVLKNKQPDVIVVGSPIHAPAKKLFRNRTSKLLCAHEFRDTALPLLLTFLPAAIIKTKKLRNCDFSIGYKLTNTFFPQFFWISQLFNENWSVYIMPSFVVTRPPIEHGLDSDFTHMNGYLTGVSLIKDRTIRHNAIKAYLGSGHITYTIKIVKMLLKDRILGRLTKENYLEHFKHLTGLRIVLFLVSTLTLLIPSFLIQIIFKKKYIKKL